MGSSINFFSGPSDHLALTEFVRSLGVYFLPPLSSQEYSDDPNVYAGCWISMKPSDELHPWGRPGEPRVQYSDVIDPLILFKRSVYQPPYLSPGHFYWNNDVPALASQTKATYQKIARWIRRNWSKPEERDQYFGPEAKKLVFEHGIIATSLVPGVALHENQKP